MKKSFQAEAIQRLEDYVEPEELTTIVIPKYDFENESKNFHFISSNEISFFDKMYDIARIDSSGDNIMITALSDNSEDNLNELFSRIFSKILSDDYSDTTSLINLIITEACLPVEFKNISCRKECVCNNYVSFPILFAILDIPTPPPKLFI